MEELFEKIAEEAYYDEMEKVAISLKGIGGAIKAAPGKVGSAYKKAYRGMKDTPAAIKQYRRSVSGAPKGVRDGAKSRLKEALKGSGLTIGSGVAGAGGSAYGLSKLLSKKESE
jgi:hypothetical protein